MHIETLPPIHLALVPDAIILNKEILERFWCLYNRPETRCSHFFHGRFENLYIDKTHIPEILPLVSAIEQAAQSILKVSSPLRYGYWFNLMRPGHQTSLHTHEETDELLSAVYYVLAPDNCGDLILGTSPLATRLQPIPGMVAFFSPQLPHAVDINASNHDRLSIAFNFGPS